LISSRYRSRTRRGGRLTMRSARALPTHPLMPATGSRKVPVATPLLGGLPGKIERPHPNPHVGHPIDHHVAGPSSVDPDKFCGPRRDARACGKIGWCRSPRSIQLGAAEPVDKFDPGSRCWGCTLLLRARGSDSISIPIRFLRATALMEPVVQEGYSLWKRSTMPNWWWSGSRR
jgi:hypothetical protein